MGYLSWKNDIKGFFNDIKKYPYKTLGVLLLILFVMIIVSMLISFFTTLFSKPTTLVSVPLYSSTQTIDINLGEAPEKDDFLNLDNVATLIPEAFLNASTGTSTTFSSFAALPLAHSIGLVYNASVSTNGTEEDIGSGSGYIFDLNKNKSYRIKAENRIFLVTLFSINGSTTAPDFEYTFGISEQ
jgi:hypothetical protein